MEWLTDRNLYYGGILLAGAAVLALILYFCISRVSISHLKKQMIKEYGKKQH